MSKRKPMASGVPPGVRVVIGHNADDIYLARIAELEEEVRKLKAELAKLAAPSLPDVRVTMPEHPLVTADGTRGMQRGVSAGQSRRGRRTGGSE